MITHTKTLTDALKLGPLRVKVKRIKVPEPGEELPVEQRSSNVLLNQIVNPPPAELDVVRRIDISERMLNDLISEFERPREDVDEDIGSTLALTSIRSDDDDFSDPEMDIDVDSSRDQNGRAKKKKKKGERNHSIVSSGAQYILDKLRSEFKTVDIFGPSSTKTKRPPTEQQLLNKALECHDAVVELKAQVDYLVKRMLKENGVHRVQTQAEDSASVEMETLARKDLDSIALSKPMRMVVPGTLLVGRISIPGLDDSPNNEDGFNTSRAYEMQIVRQVKDEAGESYFYARHVTDKERKDDQVVIITMDRNALYYEDYETQCVGSIVSGGTKLIGSVAQLEGGRPGFFVQSRNCESSFVLERSQSSEADEVNLLRSKLLTAQAGRALAFARWCGSVSPGRISNERFLGRQVDWAEVIEDMTWLCEEVSATMRRQVHLLNELDFEDLVARKAKLESLSQKGISRFQTHQNWDAATILLNHLKESCPTGSIHEQQYMNKVRDFSDKVVQRMQPCFDRFDHALRKASRRVCLAEIRRWEKIFKPKSGTDLREEDYLCVICCEPFENGKMVLETSCEHASMLNVVTAGLRNQAIVQLADLISRMRMIKPATKKETNIGH
eukprot:CAMPEP_0184019078 /NCGR_PEP_ID=MMETSP0954-20121128/8539_1 /TAXON_ID=627963 /ORGANISM="Aplanochytrium sp, Strain PBS07" /LENGTH=613 /DNA_ID=CAMNT_0026300679 /DNA_START=430 /DNA_END=2272 /DNA_ORIENTATION=-